MKSAANYRLNRNQFYVFFGLTIKIYGVKIVRARNI